MHFWSMKHFAVSIFVLIAVNSFGQNVKGYRAGGFGHFFHGPAYFNSSSLNGFIEPQGTMRHLTTSVGGEGAAVRKRLMIGGGGFGMMIQKTMTDSVAVEGGMGAGYVKAGYQMIQARNAFAYVYGAVGGGALSVNVRNNSVHEAAASESTTTVVLPGDQARYDLGLALIDAGAGVKIIFPDGDLKAITFGGLCVGLDGGCLFGLPLTQWRQSNNPIPGANAPGVTPIPYLRFTIGGCGFRAM